MQRLLVFIVSLLFCYSSWGQNHPLFVSTGAKSLALGNTSVTQYDIWSNFNNQAGLSNIKETSFGVFFENRFFNTGLNTMGISGTLPTKSGVFGASFKRFGVSDLFNQSITSLNYGRILSDNFSIGGGISYFNTFIGNNYGKAGAFSAQLGFIAKLSSSLSLGSHISNINRAKLDDFNDERYPTILTVGLNYKVSEKVEAIGEVGKDILQKPSYRGAVNYKVLDYLAIRVGAAVNPSLFSFGVGYLKNNFQIDYGASYHQVLGLTNNISLSYTIGK